MFKKRTYRLESKEVSDIDRFYGTLAKNASDKKEIIFISQYMTEKGFSEVREGRIYYIAGSVVLNNRNPLLNPVEMIGDKRACDKAVSKLEKITRFKLIEVKT